MPEERCETCKNTRAWHEANNPMHPFNDGSVSFRETFGQRTGDGVGGSARPAPRMQLGAPQTLPGPFDPVLRMALIDAGVITPDDLRAAEEKIKATTLAMVQDMMGGSGGQETSGVQARNEVSDRSYAEPAPGGSGIRRHASE